MTTRIDSEDVTILSRTTRHGPSVERVSTKQSTGKRYVRVVRALLDGGFTIHASHSPIKDATSLDAGAVHHLTEKQCELD